MPGTKASAAPAMRFGTSGWRAVLAEEFTFANVRVVCQAIAAHLLQDGLGDRGVIVGYDGRFLGERFAQTAAEVVAGNGIPVQLCDRATPSPAVAFHVLQRRLAGGITISASHNPAEYNGVKFTPAWGGPALPETTAAIEQRADALVATGVVSAVPWERAQTEGLGHRFDPRPDYLAALERLVDLAAVRGARLTIVADPMYGAARGYLDDALRRAGVRVTVLHDRRDPYFGGRRPDPTAAALAELGETVQREGAALGLATDGDADRFGIVDRDGTPVEANLILALLLDYLAESRRWTGAVARSVATTQLIDRVAAARGLRVVETPVGFKYLGDLLARGEVLMGGEESAGLAIAQHVPDKDGILACLLVAEMVARTGQSLTHLLAGLFRRVGRLYAAREDVPLTETLRARLVAVMADPPPSFASARVVRVNRLDGCKLVLADGAWFLFRPSGTEPLVRCYAEGESPARVAALLEAGKNLVSRP